MQSVSRPLKETPDSADVCLQEGASAPRATAHHVVMNSVRSLWEQSAGTTAEERPLLDTSLHLRRLLQEVIAIRGRYEQDSNLEKVQRQAQDLFRRLEEAVSAIDLAIIASEGLEAVEQYRRQSTEYFSEQGAQLQSMLAMLTTTLADITGQSETSVARLLEIERRIEQASRLEDIRELRGSLEQCLSAVREAVIQQRSESGYAVERLRDHIRSVPQSRPEAPSVEKDNGCQGEPELAEYVAVLRLQRAEYILERFGVGARDQMLAQIAEGLKAACVSGDRMMRWKGASFVMFLKSTEGLLTVRRRIAAIVAKIGQRYVEIGKHSALLAVGMDWAAYPQSKYPSLDAVFVEVDAFLARDSAGRKGP